MVKKKKKPRPKLGRKSSGIGWAKSRNFRFKDDFFTQLSEGASKLGITKTELIKRAVLKYLQDGGQDNG